MNVLAFVLLAIAGGAAVALQGVTNGQLRGHVGFGTALSVNTAVVMAASLAWMLLEGGPDPRTSGVLRAHPHLVLGGVFGIVILVAAIIAFPKLGATTALGLFIAGQLATSLMIDHLGLFGLTRAPLSLPRVGGVLLVLGGVLLSRR